MKERGIIFNAEMVRAILDGRKTQTRRIMKPQPTPCDYIDWRGKARGGHVWPSNIFRTMLHVEGELQNGDGGWKGLVGDACPFGDVGDRLWVRETWQGPLVDYENANKLYKDPEPFQTTKNCVYKADGGTHPEYFDADDNLRYGWKSSAQMPRWASRILLEITGVRVERLWDISQADAIAEGAPPSHPSIDAVSREYGFPDFPRSWFGQTWWHIYGNENWQANPWVWVIEFKQIQG
ncbi:hypothetical protein [Morganella morganii]|uniref:hypothetical protein n=1 Tax=Morganella morganii TaxID=582 RepID=UPI001E445CBD|nr:hypothetical protein [Morganella morganii]UEH05210.1 hypothetical protein LLY23_06895 [Morganella morganii]HCT3120205.1 hypothetical protein [Morganella morganii]